MGPRGPRRAGRTCSHGRGGLFGSHRLCLAARNDEEEKKIGCGHRMGQLPTRSGRTHTLVFFWCVCVCVCARGTVSFPHRETVHLRFAAWLRPMTPGLAGANGRPPPTVRPGHVTTSRSFNGYSLSGEGSMCEFRQELPSIVLFATLLRHHFVIYKACATSAGERSSHPQRQSSLAVDLAVETWSIMTFLL